MAALIKGKNSRISMANPTANPRPEMPSSDAPRYA